MPVEREIDVRLSHGGIHVLLLEKSYNLDCLLIGFDKVLVEKQEASRTHSKVALLGLGKRMLAMSPRRPPRSVK